MSSLTTPLKLGPAVLRNRNVMSAMTRNRSLPRDVPNEYNLEYYRQRAEGGAGLIISEGTLISRQGTDWPYTPGIWNDDHVVGWEKITRAVHDEGGHIFCQLWHRRTNHPDMPEQKASGKPVWGPSAIAARGGKFRSLPGTPGYVTPTPIPDPRELIEEYKNAAYKAKVAGFDGVEIHAANGYLIQQFLDNTANKRRDEWGGCVENRARFCLEVVKVAVDIWGADRVGIKLNPAAGFNDVGMPFQDTLETYSYVIQAVDALKLAYICLVRVIDNMNPTIDGKRRATSHDILATYRPLIKHAKIFLNGELTPSEAEELLAAESIDAAVFAKFWIPNPDMQRRIELGIPLDGFVSANMYYYAGEDPTKGYTDYPTVVT